MIPADSAQELRQQLSALILYADIFTDPVGQAFLALLTGLAGNHAQTTLNQTRLDQTTLSQYGRWFRALAGQGLSWPDYLLQQILQADNPFTRQAQRLSPSDLPPALVAAARHDMQILQRLYQCSPAQVSQWVQQQSSVTVPVWECDQTAPLPDWVHQVDWGTVLPDLAATYRLQGCGFFATYRAARWQQGQLRGVTHPDPVQLTELIGYSAPRQLLLDNTRALLAGGPALNVLLYGSRGSGKSSLVKALLNEYGNQGLRLVEVGKGELQDLPFIVEQLRDLAQKFILFVDDLSFESDDDAFKALKVVLEGGLTARPDNVVIYATSNRRHLVREFFEDRPRPSAAEEVHPWDTLQEKLSFSDRFGLTLTFEPADQDTYLEIVTALAEHANLSLAADELHFQALQWATRRNGRSGRTARQFIDYLRGQQMRQQVEFDLPDPE